MEDQRESHSIISQRDTKDFFHRVIIGKMWNLSQMFTVIFQRAQEEIQELS